MSRPFTARYPNAPQSMPEDQQRAWNQLVQILEAKDRQRALGKNYTITTATGIPTSATLVTTSASYTVTATTNALIKLINDMKGSGLLG